MKIESMRDYEQALHLVPKRELPPDLQTRKNALDKELEVLRKHLSFLESDLERMVVMGANPGDIANKGEQMVPIKTKILEKEKAINTLHIAPFAEAVWQEGEAILHHLKSQVQEQYAKCYEAKERYLNELAKIGELKKVSEQIAGESSRVRFDLLPARNPMSGIKTANESSFMVAMGDVERAFRG